MAVRCCGIWFVWWRGSRKGDREFAYVTRQLQVNSQITDRDHGCVLPKRIEAQPPLVSAHLRLSKLGLWGIAQLLESDTQYIPISTWLPHILQFWVVRWLVDSWLGGLSSPTPLRNLSLCRGCRVDWGVTTSCLMSCNNLIQRWKNDPSVKLEQGLILCRSSSGDWRDPNLAVLAACGRVEVEVEWCCQSDDACAWCSFHLGADTAPPGSCLLVLSLQG